MVVVVVTVVVVVVVVAVVSVVVVGGGDCADPAGTSAAEKSRAGERESDGADSEGPLHGH